MNMPGLRPMARAALLAWLWSGPLSAQTPTAPAPPAAATPGSAVAPEPATRAPATPPSTMPAPATESATRESTATPSSSPPGAADDAALVPLAWLEGCWQGTVNQRDFREQWLPLRGGMLIGAGQQVLRGRMQDYEFLRIEARPDGIYFSQFSGDRNEVSFKLASTANDDKDTIFTFANTAEGFPERLVYRRGTDGWLYETIEGKIGGSDKKVIYPLRRIGCESGELILK